MRSIDMRAAIVLLIGLLAVSAVGVAAREDGASPPFTIDFVDADFSRDEATGIRTETYQIEATDERASGILTAWEAAGEVGDERVTTRLGKASATLVNDGGTWTGRRIGGASLDFDSDDDPIGGSIWELTGENGYGGLSMYVLPGPEGLVGFIVPTDVLPAQPESPPAAEGSPGDQPAPPSGRVEMPSHGYAVTFPADWQVEHMDDPANVTSLKAFAPAVGSFTENCSVDVGGFDTRPMEESLQTVLAEESWAALGEELVDGPHGEVVALPAGAALHIDYTMRPAGFDRPVEVVMYAFNDGEKLMALRCAGVERPADDWRSIAETFELLPPDAHHPFEVELTNGDYARDEATGVETFTFDAEATDPRATGALTSLNARGSVRHHGDAFVYNIVQKAGARLETEDGSWSGSSINVSYWDNEAEEAVISAIYELVGEGDYAGLTMFLFSSGPDDLAGFIIPTETVPTQPMPGAE